MIESGLLLGTIRVAQNVSAEKLAYGLCDLSTLTKFEIGQRNVEKFLFEILYQRLGKYSGRFQTILDNDEYELLEKRWKILRCIDEKKFNEAQEIIKEYRGKTHNKLHIQYICLVECEIMHRTNVDIQSCQNKLMEGLRCTYPDFEIDKIHEYYLGRIELYMVAQYARYMQLSGENEKAVSIYYKILDIIEADRYDRTEKVLHYRYVGYWLMEYYMDKQDFKKALEVGENTFEQTLNGAFVYLIADLQENIIICKEHAGMNMEKEKSYLNILKKFYKKFGVIGAKDFFPRYIEDGVYNVNDIIKQRRISKRLKQEDLICEKCSLRTISRIENHKCTITNETRKHILRKLNFPENKYIAVVDIYDCTAFDLCNKSIDMYNRAEYDKAEELLREMEEKYEYATINSEQFFFSRYNDIAMSKTNQYRNTLQEMKDMLGKTLGDIDKVNLENVMLLENEWCIIQNIIFECKKNNKHEECLRYLQPIANTYNKTAAYNNSYIHMCVRRKMGDILGELGKVDEANDYIIDGIKATCKLEFLPYLHVLTYLYAWNILEMKDNISIKERDICKEMLEYAYVIADIYDDKYKKNLILDKCVKHEIKLGIISYICEDH